MDDLDLAGLNALLQEQLRILGPDHPETLMTRHVLTRTLVDQGHYGQAISLYEKLLDDRTRVLGADHRDTFSTRHNLALCRAQNGDIERSIREFDELLPDIAAALGDTDTHVFHSRQQYAVVLGMAGRTVDAVESLKGLFLDIRQAGRGYSELAHQTLRLIEGLREPSEGPDDLDEEAVPPDDSDGEPENHKIQIRLGRGLVARAADLLGREASEVAAVLSTDATSIAESLNGSLDPKIAFALFSGLGVEPVTEPNFLRLQIIRDLVAIPDTSAGRVASQVGIAYVEIANLAASLDQKWDDQESRIIDELRREIREILGKKLDTTSDEALEFERQFEDIVGLDSVKKQLLGFVNLLIENRRRAQRGGDGPAPRLHLAFTGSPGTGKTTVARMYGRLLSRLGLLDSDKFTEVDKTGLVDVYLGETEAKTSSVIQGANPGVLFIDEAYALNDSHPSGKGHGEIALEVIIKNMEDKRASLAVVLAGYTTEIEGLMKVNPGLRSRIAAVIDFPDYSTDELMEIARRTAARQGVRIHEDAEPLLRQLIEVMRKRRDFGNARDVENLIFETLRNQTSRLAPLDDLATDAERAIVLPDDVPATVASSNRPSIGFGNYL